LAVAFPIQCIEPLRLYHSPKLQSAIPEFGCSLAEQARDKDLLGYHDIRVGNEPDKRLVHFFENNLPGLLADARTAFDKNKDLLREYADGSLSYKHFTKELPEGPPVEIEEEGP
jgi:hypothetical protein